MRSVSLLSKSHIVEEWVVIYFGVVETLFISEGASILYFVLYVWDPYHNKLKILALIVSRFKFTTKETCIY